MERDVNILNLLRKVICSLLCITKNTSNDYLETKSSYYLEKYLKKYELYNNKSNFYLDDIEEIVDFCNECYEDKDVFDYAEDVEYGLKELKEITRFKGEK